MILAMKCAAYGQRSTHASVACWISRDAFDGQSMRSFIKEFVHGPSAQDPESLSKVSSALEILVPCEISGGSNHS